MNRIKIGILSASLLGLFALPLTLTATSSAITQADKEAACAGLGAAGTNCAQADAENSVARLVRTVVNILSLIVGVASVIMLIIGGFRYVISAGDANSLTSARNTILYALIGLAIAAVAQVLVRFVLVRIIE